MGKHNALSPDMEEIIGRLCGMMLIVK